MRVLHLVKATQLGGAERHLLYLLPLLRAQGVDARLVVMTEPSKPMQAMFERAEADGVPIERVLIRGNADATVLARLVRALRPHKAEILHTHLVHADLFGQVVRPLIGVRKHISTRHNDDSFRYQREMRALNRLNWAGLSAGIVISEALRAFVIDVEGAPAHKLNVIPYGMAFTRLSHDALLSRRTAVREVWGIPPQAFVVGMACRLVEQKGVMYAIQALKLLHERKGDVRLVIAGDGELRGQLAQLAQGLGVAEHVHFLGWQEDVPALMAGFDVFAMPSLWEGFGLVMLEAMASRLPIVASHVSAIPEIVTHGDNGFLVAPRDPQALAYALELLHDDRQLRLYMGQNGEDRLETHFSPQRMANLTQEVYARVLG
jgi:glycosyltransferase involved in cell wall biosynthesis